MSDTPERMGQQIGEYLLQRQLGRGTFGVVYLAEHVHDHTQAAVKLLRLQLSRSLELKDFLNEARVIRLRHPHIIPILDFGISPDDMPFLVMEYASGGTLRDRFWHGSSLPLPEIVTYTTQLASALQFAHSRRLIHRDVKPENMLLHADGTVLLSDFGIAKMMEQSATMSTNAQAGTPAYMAPEQGQGEPCPASDQYALAVVVYEWLTGRRPFLGTPLEIVVQHRLNSPPPLRIFRQAIPLEVERVILKAMAKKPEERFASIADFAQALQFAFDGAVTERVPAILPREQREPEAIEQPEGNLLETELVPGRPSASLPPPAATIKKTSMNQEKPPLDLMTDGTNFTLWDKTQSAIPDPTPTESDGTQMTPDILSLNPRRARRLFWPKKRWVFPLVLFLLLIVSGFSGYLFLLRPGFLTNNVQGPNIYNTAIATNGVMVGFDAQHSSNNIYEHTLNAQNVSRLTLKWSVHAGNSLEASPVIANGLVYVGSQDGTLSAFNALTGQQKWTTTAGAPIVLSAPAVAAGLVYIGSQDGKLSAFDATTGQSGWTATLDSAITTSPIVAHGLVYIASSSGQLYAFDAQSGKQIWQTPTGQPVSSSPAFANGLVYIGSPDGKLSAFNATTGRRLWQVSLANTTIAAQVIVNGLVYISSQDIYNSQNNRLYALIASSGEKKWVTPDEPFAFYSPAVANHSVYASTQNGQLYAFDADSGKEDWASSQTNARFSSPMIANNLIYTASENGQIYAFDTTTGKQLWSEPSSAIASTPAIANGFVYAFAQQGMLNAFALA